jgi:O-acetyl-ADP-ribose deacetylase (regulator of RNase III)
VPPARRLRDRRREDHGRRPPADAPRDPRVGPVWRGGGQGEAELLASCYRRAIELADEHGDARVAFPAISTGVYAYPLDEAAGVAIRATQQALAQHPPVEEARFWLFGDAAYAAFESAHSRYGSD